MFKPESIEAIKKMYADKKETIEYLCKFGTKNEKIKAKMIKEMALGTA